MNVDCPVTVAVEDAAPKVAVAVMVKGAAALTTVTNPVELTVAMVVSLLVQVTYGVRAPLSGKGCVTGKGGGCNCLKGSTRGEGDAACNDAEGGWSGARVENDSAVIADHSAIGCSDRGVAVSSAARSEDARATDGNNRGIAAFPGGGGSVVGLRTAGGGRSG